MTARVQNVDANHVRIEDLERFLGYDVSHRIEEVQIVWCRGDVRQYSTHVENSVDGIDSITRCGEIQ